MRYPTRLITWALILGTILILAGLLLPVTSTRTHCTIAGDTLSTENWVVTAIIAYREEYGHLPGNRPDGRYEDAAGNAQIFSVLRALDSAQNPRNISYFEAKDARPRKTSVGGESKLHDGFDPQTGVFLDPYGNPYRIRMASVNLPPVSSPYQDAPAGGNTVLVWSLGPDGKQGGTAGPSIYEGSDDVLSWHGPSGR